jgi:hypothetical protein
MHISIKLTKTSEATPNDSEACLFVTKESPNVLLSGVYYYNADNFHSNNYNYDATKVLGWASNNVTVEEESKQ